MAYRLEIGSVALERLRSLPKKTRRQIGIKLDLLEHDFSGDVKKLKGSRNEYRLRVGSFRALFTLEGDLIFVYDVLDRKQAYE